MTNDGTISQALADLHGLASKLHDQLDDLEALVGAAEKVGQDATGDVPVVEQVARDLFDGVVSLGREGFADLIHKLRPSSPAGPADTPPPSSEALTPGPAETDPAPVAGIDPPAADETAAPVAGIEPPPEVDAAPVADGTAN